MAKTKEHRYFHVIHGNVGSIYTTTIGYSFNEYYVKKFIESTTNPDQYMYESFNETELVTILDSYDLEEDEHRLYMICDQYNPNNYIITCDSIYTEILEMQYVEETIRESTMILFKAKKLLSVIKDKEVLQTIDKLSNYVSLLKLTFDTDLTTVFGIVEASEEIQTKIEMDGCDALINPYGLFKEYYKNNY